MPATPRRARNFGGSSQHQRLMMANLAASLFAAEAITTTEAKAKALRPVAEKLITKAKKAQEGPMRVHRIRQIQGYLGDREMTHKLVNDVAPRYTERNGGYTRILKMEPRPGDAAPMALMQLVDKPGAPAEQAEKPKKAAKKPARKKAAPAAEGEGEAKAAKPRRKKAAAG